MLEIADRNMRRSGLAGRIRLGHADATNFDPYRLFGELTFERIFFSYALSMIPAWQVALSSAAARLAPGGSLHIVDFGNGEGLPRVANTLLRAWLRRFHVEPRDDLGSELQRVATASRSELVLTPMFRGYATYAVLSRR
jgi:S-adenosylmethionine-diacylgycerolhomoserine-N-methlytransferase